MLGKRRAGARPDHPILGSAGAHLLCCTIHIYRARLRLSLKESLRCDGVE
jgi:hypothetical protein